jgi:hypothetical protein
MFMADEEGKDSWMTTTNSPEQMLKLMLLWKREGFIQASMIQQKVSMNKGQIDPSRTGMWLHAMWLDIIPMLMGSEDGKRIEEKLRGAVGANDVNTHIQAYIDLSSWLYKKGLLKWDNRGGYDSSKLSEVLKKMNE